MGGVASRDGRAPQQVGPRFTPPENRSKSNGFEADRNVPLAKGEQLAKLGKIIGTDAGFVAWPGNRLEP
jgi:hypothetical protein